MQDSVSQPPFEQDLASQLQDTAPRRAEEQIKKTSKKLPSKAQNKSRVDVLGDANCSRQRRRNWQKAVFSVSRDLHVYCSTALCLLLIFFSVTGITLNHQWSMLGSEQNTEQQARIPLELIKNWVTPTSETQASDWHADIAAIQQYLTETYHLPVPSSIEIDKAYYEIVFEYKAPASYASAIVAVDTGAVAITTESGSALGILNDLHKGRHTGAVWRWLIDIAAAVMVVFSVSGLIIVFQGRKYQRSGLLAIVSGTLFPLAMYFLFVPIVG